MVRIPAWRQGRLPGLADAPDDAHGSGAQEVGGLGPADHREPARLVEIGGNLGEELVVATDRRSR